MLVSGAFLANLHRVYIGQIERCEKSPTFFTLQKLPMH